MLYDFIMTDKSDSLPLYRQIYRSVRESIENGSMKMNSRLPSIRRLSDNLGVSKTTVIAAYDQLCAEGYIVNRPQKGYFVAADFQNSPAQIEAKKDYSNIENKHYEYDFSTKSIDEAIIKFSVWRKEVKDIINRSYLLTSYGDVQGEEALRNALQKYALGTRSVNARAENIVVGAGTQAILSLLCSLLGGGKRVAVQEKSFVQAEYVLRSFGNEIFYFESDSDGVTIDSLNQIQPQILLINPNYAGTEGKTMPVARRLEIIEWAAKNNALIIEDDYNGELRYSTHPTPCVQNLRNGTDRLHRLVLEGTSPLCAHQLHGAAREADPAIQRCQGAAQSDRLQDRTAGACLLYPIGQDRRAYPKSKAYLSRKSPRDARVSE